MTVESRSADGVLTLRLLEKDARNALDLSTVGGLRSALASARADDTLRLVVLESGLERVFSLGMNLERLAAAGRDWRVWDSFGAISGYADLLIEIATMPVPTLAVVDGVAAGGGVELACVCDTLIGTENASFSIAQLRKGIFPFLTSAVLVPRIGQGCFLHWAMSGQTFGAKRLLELGLLHQLCTADECERAVSIFSERVLSFEPQTLRAGISTLRAEADGELRGRIRHALALFTLNCLSVTQESSR